MAVRKRGADEVGVGPEVVDRLARIEQLCVPKTLSELMT
jgi:hypothetical protein